jgi:hypothetical protein
MRRERYENGFMVFLKVRKMSAVFVLAFHLLKYYHDWQARARTPAPTLGDVVPKQNDLDRASSLLREVGQTPVTGNYAIRGRFELEASSAIGSAILFSSG